LREFIDEGEMLKEVSVTLEEISHLEYGSHLEVRHSDINDYQPDW
jgi:hypothetical protein